MNAEEIAEKGETLAAAWLEQEGWEIVERNWVHEIGELDIVAMRVQRWGDREVQQFAFVEVKAREVSVGPRPEVRVGARKRRKVATLAKLYLAIGNARDCLARFDVIGVDLDTGEIRHYPAAFDAEGRLR